MARQVLTKVGAFDNDLLNALNTMFAELYAGSGAAGQAIAPASVAATGAITGASLAVTGALTSSSASAGVGYATGAGGTVTQATNKSTGVTLSKVCGQITMNNAALAAGAEVSFTVTNTQVGAQDVVAACIASGATAGAYALTVDAVAAGSFRVSISNQSAGSLGEAIVINFVVIKGVAA